MPIDPTNLTNRTAASNLGAMGTIQQLTDQINALNLAAQQKANMGRIPGEAGLEATSSANIANLLAGQVSPSTINLLGQQSAERGVMSGSPTGPSTNADFLRALGLTSEGLQAQGQTELSGAVARNPAAPITDPTNQMMTPQQLGELQLHQEQLSLEAARIAAQKGGGGDAGAGTGAGTGTAPINWRSLFPDTTTTARTTAKTPEPGATQTVGAGAGTGTSEIWGPNTPGFGMTNNNTFGLPTVSGFEASPTGGTVNTGWSPDQSLSYDPLSPVTYEQPGLGTLDLGSLTYNLSPTGGAGASAWGASPLDWGGGTSSDAGAGVTDASGFTPSD